MSHHPRYFSGKLKAPPLQLGSQITITSNTYSLRCSLTKQELEHAPDRLVPTIINYLEHQVQVAGFEREGGVGGKWGVNAQFGVGVDCEEKEKGKDIGKMCGQQRQMFDRMYQCVYFKSQNKLVLRLSHTEDVSLSLFQIDKPKFAKTQKLEQFISGVSNEQYGIVTMDQSSRILVQSNECSFPAVGVWAQAKTIHEASVYFTICAFLRKKPTKQLVKLASTMNHRSHIYFVKIQPNQLPQLYLVSWTNTKLSTPVESTITYNVLPNTPILLEFNQENMEFTLRGEHAHRQIGNQLGFDFVSPRKQITNEELEEQLDRLHLQDSPQFSSIKKCQEIGWREERTQLKETVNRQQQEIQTLKKQIQRLTKQLKKAQSSNQSPSDKPLHFFKSPTLIFNSDTPVEKGKKLSSRDLQLTESKMKVFGSGSTKQKNSMESMEGSSTSRSTSNDQPRETTSNGQSREIRDVLDQEPWDYYEIIE